jgi:hypothetical protein
MRLRKSFLCCFVILFSAVGSRADGIDADDPKIIVGRGSDATQISSLNFPVLVNQSTGGNFLEFENDSGQDWVGLIITVTFPNALAAKNAAISCLSDIFSPCQTPPPTSRHGQTLTIIFTGGGTIVTCATTINCPADSEFFVDLNTGDTLTKHSNGNGGWKNDTIEVQAIPAPEPATLALLLAGLTALLLIRKRA